MYLSDFYLFKSTADDSQLELKKLFEIYNTTVLNLSNWSDLFGKKYFGAKIEELPSLLARKKYKF